MASVFTIQIKSGYSTQKITIKHVPVDERTERFHFTLEGQPYIIESNRPFFRNRGLKHRRPDWKVIEGNTFSQTSLDPVKAAIMNHLEPKSKSPK